MNNSTASFRTYSPLLLFRYEPTTKSSCSFKAGSRFVELTEGGMDMQIQELWQCQHWTITPRCYQSVRMAEAYLQHLADMS
ncbi:hypothetical protein DPMN_045361 [Dreissena polymorpha]|uniref:Uncharacterized protein n=1 Tax=Dreissena polymorpha TaxID=45954 RepID=A0A9D4D4X8_DREPO|nr:hypothetical protein DPMN_045361 [Dreissena polymorpha]